ncbi:MAG TPA: hypothetical protein VEA81_10490 [Burkholderiaceae bacterium]|nr:hypothetical protein [Burkholderiaceae bacterium]
MKTVAAVLFLLACSAVRAAPGPIAPCESPEKYVSGRGGEVAPLVHPYVVGGMAVVALRRAGDERWLELAASSVPDARLQLARSAGAPAEVLGWNERVWLRCPSGAPASRT